MGILANLQFWVFLVLTIAIFAFALVAFVESLRYPDENYRATDKKSKKFWSILLFVCVVVTFLALPLPRSYTPFFVSMLSLVASGIFWGDVRPAIRSVDRRRNKRR